MGRQAHKDVGKTTGHPQDMICKVLSWPVTGTVSSTLSGTLPAVSQNSPGRFSSETLIPRRVSGQDSGG